MRPGFWIRFQSFFPNLTIFYLDDSVFVVADMSAESYIRNLIGNLVNSGENWVDETEQDIGVKIVILVAHDQLTP